MSSTALKFHKKDEYLGKCLIRLLKKTIMKNDRETLVKRLRLRAKHHLSPLEVSQELRTPINMINQHQQSPSTPTRAS